MCGIAGAVWEDDRDALGESALRRMLDRIRHRGPDADGAYVSEQVALGHRRLSIIDLSEAGRQPMQNEDGAVRLTFNGEVYNFEALREELVSAGHQFRSGTDTEVIVHGYEEWGDAVVDRLRGFFAFALWDGRPDKNRLLLARDRTGQKPLFYRMEESGRLLFGSELKTVMAAPGVPREVDSRAMALYLTYQYVPDPHCILKGCAKLSPGSLAVWRSGHLDVRRYWSAPYDEPDHSKSREDWSVELRETLTEAVRLRMRSDVPLGAFLSGGVDSTVIAGLMQSLSDRQVHTFSIGFPNAEYDETAYAKEAAEKLGTEHHVEVVDPSALESLPALAYHYDEPFGDSSAIPTMHVSHFARRHVTVSLSGDGGDELFAGYERYRAVALAGRLDRLGVRALWRLPFWGLLPRGGSQKSFLRRVGRFAEGMGAGAAERYLRWISHFDPRALGELLSTDVQKDLGEFTTLDYMNDRYADCSERGLITQTTCADVHSYLPCDILTKVDVASMSASLEARSPLLDHHVVELAARMPAKFKVDMGGGRFSSQMGRGKAILTDTFADLLPPSIQTRKKMGFGVPIGEWFRGELKPLIDGVVLSERALDRGLFRPDAVRRIAADHQSGAWDHRYRLWTLLMLEVWQRTWLDTDSVPDGPDAVDLAI